MGCGSSKPVAPVERPATPPRDVAHVDSDPVALADHPGRGTGDSVRHGNRASLVQTSVRSHEISDNGSGRCHAQRTISSNPLTSNECSAPVDNDGSLTTATMTANRRKFSMRDPRERARRTTAVTTDRSRADLPDENLVSVPDPAVAHGAANVRLVATSNTGTDVTLEITGGGANGIAKPTINGGGNDTKVSTTGAAVDKARGARDREAADAAARATNAVGAERTRAAVVHARAEAQDFQAFLMMGSESEPEDKGTDSFKLTTRL